MASNARAIVRALKATQGGMGTPGQVGGYGSNPSGGPSLGHPMSPLVASYSEWQGGRFYGQNNSLPRDWETFLSGSYGPLEPIKPVPIDMPREGEERPEPRRREYPVGWDMPMGMPGSEGWGKLATFKSLREMADSYSIARTCLQLRRNELRGLGWDIGPTRAAAKAMRGDHKAARDFAERRAEVVKFFRRPDPDYQDFTSWFTTLIEDVLVIDAPALYLHPSRVKGKGVLGTNLAALEIIDGATIKPLVDIRGGKPKPPNPAYQCYSPDTEILTRRGWLSFTDLRMDDEIAGRTPDGRFRWQRPTRIIAQNHEGELIRFHGRGMDLLVTPDHRMLWTPEGGARGLERVNRASEIEWRGQVRGGGCLVATSRWEAPDLESRVFRVRERATKGPAPKAITMTGDQYAAFMGMWLAEGSAFCVSGPKYRKSKGDTYRIQISQKADGNGDKEYKELLTAILGREPNRNGGQYVFDSRALCEYLMQFGHSHDKFIPQDIKDMSARQLAIFWHYYWLGDGSSERWQQTALTASKRLAGDLQEILQKLGYSTSIRMSKRCRNDGVEIPHYKLRVRKTKYPQFNTSRVPYAGPVYCVSVPDSIVYVRRNGHAVWCGNCFEFGVPRVDLMTMLHGQDMPDAERDKMAAEYRGDQLLYLPMNLRSWTVYGFAPVEQAIIPVMSGLAKQQYGLNFFSEGTLPGAYISVGDPGQSPSQMAEWQTTLNAIAGDQAWKHKVIALPGGSKVEPQKMITLADAFDSMVQIETAMAFDVQPYEIGAIPNLAAAAAAGGPSGSMAKTQVQASRKPTERVANVALLLFLKATVFDRVIQGVFGQHDMEMTFEGLEEAENAAEITDMAIEQIGSGLLSIDEGRQMIGRDPWGLPITSDPVWATQWGGAVPLTGIAQATAQPQGGSPSPAHGGGQPQAAVDLTGPGGVSRPGAPSAQIPGTHTGLPRNQQSRGQRRTQAAGVSGTQAGAQRSPGTPAHSGARAERAKRPAAASKGELAAKVRELLEADEPPIDGEKAARELSLLKSHLNRGGTVTEWERRFLPPRALAVVSEHLAKGLDASRACDMARAMLSGELTGV